VAGMDGIEAPAEDADFPHAADYTTFISPAPPSILHVPGLRRRDLQERQRRYSAIIKEVALRGDS
jgi:hypothetical protein